MGLFFTFLYIATAYLAPSTLFGEFADLHVEVIVVLLALIFTVPKFPGSGTLGWIQTWAIAGLCLTVACSFFFTGWIGGGVTSVINILPALITFFLISLNCTKPVHLKALVVMLFLIAVFIVGNGVLAMRDPDTHSPYVLLQGQGVEDGQVTVFIPRIQGLTFLGDPNDFGQFLVALMPCLFFFWKKGQGGKNLLLVYLPVIFLIYAVALTRSRGAELAMIAVIIFAARRKIGTTFSAIAGGILFVGLSAAGFTGGREVSAGQGQDRIAAWSAGLNLIRAHPFFGVGMAQFSEYYEITAHNTVVVCGAELGLTGLFCWLVFMAVNVRNMSELAKTPEQLALEASKAEERDAIRFGRPALAGSFQTGTAFAAMEGGDFARKLAPVKVGVPVSPLSYENDPTRFEPERDQKADDDALRRLAKLMVLCFVGFFTAGWFLSRAYTMVLYVYAGMSMAIFSMATKRGIAPPTMEWGRAAKLAAVLSVGLLLVVYVIIRVDHLRGNS